MSCHGGHVAASTVSGLCTAPRSMTHRTRSLMHGTRSLPQRTRSLNKTPCLSRGLFLCESAETMGLVLCKHTKITRRT